MLFIKRTWFYVVIIAIYLFMPITRRVVSEQTRHLIAWRIERKAKALGL